MPVLDIDTFILRAKNIYSEQSLRHKEIVLRKYDKFLEERGLKPGIESLNLWVDELIKSGLSSNSIYVYVYDVLSYFDLMMIDVDEKKLRMLKRRIQPRTIKQVEFLTDDEVASLISNTHSPIRKLIYALCYAYARRLGEVLSLTRSDIDLNNDTITFTILKKKSNERATYRLEPWIKEMLIKYDSFLGKDKLFNITDRAVEIGFKKDCMRAGIKPNGRNLRPHILRHSRITSLREKGVPLDLISKYLAKHSRYDVTIQFYRGVTEEEKISIPEAGEVLGFGEKRTIPV